MKKQLIHFSKKALAYSGILCCSAIVLFSCNKGTDPVVPPTPKDTTKPTNPDPKPDPNTPGDVVGKVVVGYQGWFACAGDSSPVNILPKLNRWVHWGTAPKPTFELWPDVREYTKTYRTGYANLGNGQPAKLYSSTDEQTVATHFKWMKDYEIDCAAVQRFGADFGDYVFKAQKDSILVKVARNAAPNNIKFYVMYDISGWTNFKTDIKTDWTNTVKNQLHSTDSPAYAKQNGKPVVCIWGFGHPDRPGTPADCAEIIQWFKDQGCYVIVGTTTEWRTGAYYSSLIKADMITPWSVGSYKYDVEIDNYYTNTIAKDLEACKANGVAFQPVVFPGFAWSNWNGGAPNMMPRNKGAFQWKQMSKVREYNIPNMYVAMFDEYDEGTAIAKAAEDVSMIPTDHYFLTLDADGSKLSSDFYLRLTRDGGKLIKKVINPSTTAPTPYQ